MLTLYLLFKLLPKIVLFEYASLKFVAKAILYLVLIDIVIVILLIV